MKMADLVRFGDADEVIANLKKLGMALSRLSTQVRVKDKGDTRRVSLIRISAYAAGQLFEMAVLYERDSGIEAHAWRARNLFEAWLLCENVLADDERADQFVGQKGSDELSINEGFAELAEDPDDPALIPVRERSKRLRRVLKKHGFSEGSYWSVGALAKKTGNTEEYEAFFKLYSKYVHPSAWLLLSEPEEHDTLILRNMFVIKGQEYAARVLRLGEELASQQ